MATAILGWGSLCWAPGELITTGPWRTTGPWLPVEFARISRADRLMLCLLAGTPPVRTYWILSGLDDAEAARDNLRLRENCPTTDSIGYLAKSGASHFRPLPGLAESLKSWLEAQPDVEDVIWCDLRSNFEARTGGLSFTVENGIEWLQNLVRANRHQRAEEYIRNAPPQTDTPLRQRARELFGWTDLMQNIDVAQGAASTGR